MTFNDSGLTSIVASHPLIQAGPAWSPATEGANPRHASPFLYYVGG